MWGQMHQSFGKAWALTSSCELKHFEYGVLAKLDNSL
jgi:hypothetical protein